MDIPSSVASIPYRIRIGVTGHRTLPNPEILSQKIAQLLDLKTSGLLHEQSLHRISTSDNPAIRFSVVTPLAEGADRLVAREVLKTPGAIIAPVLPLPVDDYVSDFKSPESKSEFAQLLAQARTVVTLPTPVGVEGSALRKRAYENVGKYVVDHCDILVALWDGQPAAGAGGTAEIVAYARDEERPLVILSTQHPHDITIEKTLSLDLKALDKIRAFNDEKISSDELTSYSANVESTLFPGGTVRPVPEERKKLIREMLIPYYVIASKAAKCNQRIYLRSGSFVFTASALAVGIAALSIIFPHYSTHLFSAEALLLLLIAGVVHWADRRRAHKKWIEGRFLTERIRASFFFAAAGVEISPIRIPPYLLVAHNQDDWMVRVFDEIWNRLPRLPGCDRSDCSALSTFVRTSWIQDQIDYHSGKASNGARISTGFERAGKVVFVVALFAALSHILVSLLDPESHASPSHHFLTYLALALPAAGAAIGGIRTHREYSRLEKRSINMAAALRDLDRRFARVSNHEELESLLRETEELMLRESQDWLMLMKFVKLETAA